MSKNNSKAKKKLCWNCEGSVSVKEDNCSFCGVYIGDLDGNNHHHQYEEDLDPPYQLPEDQEQAIPGSPYGAQSSSIHDLDNTSDTNKENIDEEKVNGDFKQLVMSLGLLMSGSVFLLFGFALFLFARHGVFTLQWNAAYWVLYLVVGLLLGFWGWRRLQSVEDA